ncbi:MAG: hypothetical protein IPH77_21000 [Ignavibacteria bacterium]|nr:hypothetical protein [Ignavibacteria bacterium]
MTNNNSESLISSNNAWCVASSGSVVHVVWYDYRDGNSEIYYKRLIDGGVSWSADMQLTEDYENGKITMEEYMKKSQEYLALMQGKATDMRKSVMEEAGFMVTAADKISEPESIPADDDKCLKIVNFINKKIPLQNGR